MSSRVSKMISRIDSEYIKRGSQGGVYKKTVFHIHTPASYDYGLFERGDLEVISDYQIVTEMNKIGIPIDLEEYSQSLDNLLISDENKVFKDGKELALYCLMAKKLSDNNFEIVVVADHNTFSGVKKLKEAFKINKKSLKTSIPQVFYGIEISCSDKHHVVVIIDNQFQSKMLKLAEEWLEKYIISKDGTYLPSLLVIKYFIDIGAIAYIAHFNTSDLFKDFKFLSGTYKRELFSNPVMNVIGLSDMGKQEWIQNKITSITERKFNYILDEDSHTLEELGKKPFWLKGQSVNFNTILYAFNDFDNSISFDITEHPEIYVKGLYIEGATFLKAQESNKDGVVFTFSKYMNSFIGGRGSGKSTVLNTLEFLISQLISNEKIFDSVLPQGDLCVHFIYKEKDYYISSLNSTFENNMIFRDRYFELNSGLSFDRLRREEVLGRIQVWEKSNKKVREVTRRKELLDKIYTRKFSISDLVNSAQNDDSINIFIKRMVQGDNILKKKIIINPKDEWKSILTAIDNIDKKLSNQEKIMLNQIYKYNNTQDGILRIKYSQNKTTDFDFSWKDIIYATRTNIDKSFYGFAISFGGIIQYLDDLSNDVGVFNLVKLLKEKKFESIIEFISMKDYQMSNKIVFELGYNKLETKEVIYQVLEKISRCVIRSSKFIIEELRRFYNGVDIWNIEFNINNRTGMDQRKPEYKAIYSLSMGQKVVTMLNFILSFSEFIQDYSPLIIDQPEDNLDNQYIYDNLVNMFRNLKKNRQIIIASHNSTIVVNSTSELVYVMDSNSKNGWIEKKGYCKEQQILKAIINKLEGGDIAFSRKNWLYGTIK
ncbi:Spaf_1101 family AAA-like ATPase [Enterococcus sp. LJL98]